MKPKIIIKFILTVIGALIASPLAILAVLEKHLSNFEYFFNLGSHSVALIPGLPGNFIRAGYYILTLEKFHYTAIVSFGSYFSKRFARMGKNSGAGAYCIFGMVEIGENVRIASRVSIVSGLHAHGSSNNIGQNFDSQGERDFITIGDNCWLGESSTIGAHIGQGSIIGLGSVVTKEIPPYSMAMGNPARILPTAVNLQEKKQNNSVK